MGSADMHAQRPGFGVGGHTVASDGGEWVGMEVAEGRYKVLGRIGQGSMGSVYLAYDRHLETDVVLKFPGRGMRPPRARSSSIGSPARSARWSSSAIRTSSRSSTRASWPGIRTWSCSSSRAGA